jgi:hypothetical protein
VSIVENERLDSLSPKNAFTVKDRSVVGQAWAKSAIKSLFVRPMAVVVSCYLKPALFGPQPCLFN